MVFTLRWNRSISLDGVAAGGPSTTDTSRHVCAKGSARVATNYDQVLPSGVGKSEIGEGRGFASAESPAWVASAAEKARATTAAMSTMRLGSVICFVISFLPRV